MEQIHILIVEDRVDYQRIFHRIVQKLGYNSEIATTAKESQQLLNNRFFYVALVDLSLSDEDPENRDGLLVLDEINKLDKGTQCIIMTAYGKIVDADKCFRQYHVLGFVDKAEMDINNIIERIQNGVKQVQIQMKAPRRTISNGDSK